MKSNESSVFYGVGDLAREVRAGVRSSVPWRDAALWGIALGLCFTIRGAFDLLHPVDGNELIYQWSGRGGFLIRDFAGMAICFLAAFHGAWRSRDFGHGGVVALTAIMISFVVAVVGNVSAVLVISTSREMNLQEHLYGAVEVPLPVMLMIGGFIGAAGAAIAVGLRRVTDRTRVHA